jgi:hypothetical protein
VRGYGSGDGSEQVVRCADCGALSSADLRGRSGWALRYKSALRVVDICPECQPLAGFSTSRAAADTTRITGDACDSFSAEPQAAGVGLAIDDGCRPSSGEDEREWDDSNMGGRDRFS